MSELPPVWAVIPIKNTALAKQRLSGLLSPAERRTLALAMSEDVLDAVTQVRELAGVIVVTADPAASAMALRRGATATELGAHDGHTGAVMATGRRLASDGQAMLVLPADIPLIAPGDVRAILAARKPGRSFTIVPARDFRGSNAVLVSPADAVPLRFGENSFYAHLAAARAAGIEAAIVRRAAIEMDIDTPDDVAAFLTADLRTQAGTLLASLTRRETTQQEDGVAA